jgi:hypothetical protein
MSGTVAHSVSSREVETGRGAIRTLPPASEPGFHGSVCCRFEHYPARGSSTVNAATESHRSIGPGRLCQPRHAVAVRQ